MIFYEPVSNIRDKLACAYIEDSNQSSHPHILISVLVFPPEASGLSFVVSDFWSSHFEWAVSWVRCVTWLDRFLIFALLAHFLTLEPWLPIERPSKTQIISAVWSESSVGTHGILYLFSTVLTSFSDLTTQIIMLWVIMKQLFPRLIFSLQQVLFTELFKNDK